MVRCCILTWVLDCAREIQACFARRILVSYCFVVAPVYVGLRVHGVLTAPRATDAQ